MAWIGRFGYFLRQGRLNRDGKPVVWSRACCSG
jgi:hypothetical protein